MPEPTIPLAPIPRTIDELGLPETVVVDLILRRILLDGRTLLSRLSDALGLTGQLTDSIVRYLREDKKYVDFESMIGRDWLVALTPLGKKLANDSVERISYAGIAPVSLSDYRRVIAAQTRRPMVTRKGVIKKSKLSEFENVRRNGLIAIGLDDGDELLAVDLSSGDRDVLLATHDGMAVHFSEKDVRPMGRPARGVKAITLAAGDEVVAMDIVEDERTEVLIVTSHAFGKRTPIDDYRHTSRGGKGVKAFAKEKEIGHVVDQILVKPEDEVLLITSANQVIRIAVSQIRRAGRSTKGVRLQRLAEGDEVIAIANLGIETKRVEEITGEPPATG